MIKDGRQSLHHLGKDDLVDLSTVHKLPSYRGNDGPTQGIWNAYNLPTRQSNRSRPLIRRLGNLRCFLRK
jgi:hypothetical protein